MAPMSKISTVTRFGLIRHAMTEWNCQKRIQGKTDTELIKEGVDQAESWGRLLKAFRWHRIVCSDLRRAKTTADIINKALSLPLFHDHRLREQDWGRWEGETIKALRRDNPQQLEHMEAAGWGFCPPEGEVRLSVLKRSQQALFDAAAKWPGETIMVVCHGGVIKCLLYHLCERQFLPHEPPLIRSYHLHWVLHEPNGLLIEDLNALDLGSPP